MQIKEAVEAKQLAINSPEQIGGALLYLGSDERTAARRFYIACKEAMADPLIVYIQVERAQREGLWLGMWETLIKVWVRPGLDSGKK